MWRRLFVGGCLLAVILVAVGGVVLFSIVDRYLDETSESLDAASGTMPEVQSHIQDEYDVEAVTYTWEGDEDPVTVTVFLGDARFSGMGNGEKERLAREIARYVYESPSPFRNNVKPSTIDVAYFNDPRCIGERQVPLDDVEELDGCSGVIEESEGFQFAGEELSAGSD